MQDRRVCYQWRLLQNFGSAHEAGFNMAFCDGTVRSISFAINPTVTCNWVTVATASRRCLDRLRSDVADRRTPCK